MKQLWAPWRMTYIELGTEEEGCIFCTRFQAPDLRAALVLAHTNYTVVMLNKYPYNNGHLMVVPRRHTGDYASLDRAELDDLQRLLQIAVRVVDEVYHPAGANLGMNIGRDAGAGIDGHLHWHLVPRWRGDTNFMPVVASAKVMIETLAQTWDALHPRFEVALSGG